MWISRMIGKNGFQPTAEKGEVTLSSSENWEADASRSVRNISTYAPYGYTALPPVGEEVLLLPTADDTVALGTKCAAGGLSAGEVRIRSAGGACIALKNDGSIVLNGTVTIDKGGRIKGWQAG